MISYLVDAVLLVALAFTSMRVTKMHRELARLRAYQGEFSAVVHETTGAFDTVVSTAHDFAGNLGRLALALNGRIEQAHELIAKLDARLPPPAAAKPERGGGETTSQCRSVPIDGRQSVS
jgi:hypothetical protein